MVAAQLGFLALGCLVYLIPDMQTLEIVLSSFGVLAIPLWFYVPESPRWLLSKGRYVAKNKYFGFN